MMIGTIWYVIRIRKSWNLVWSGSNIHCWHCIGIVHCWLCVGIIHVSWESTQMSCRQRKTDLSNCRRLARWRSTYYRHHALLCCHVVLERDTHLIWKWHSIISVGGTAAAAPPRSGLATLPSVGAIP